MYVIFFQMLYFRALITRTFNLLEFSKYKLRYAFIYTRVIFDFVGLKYAFL